MFIHASYAHAAEQMTKIAQPRQHSDSDRDREQTAEKAADMAAVS